MPFLEAVRNDHLEKDEKAWNLYVVDSIAYKVF